MGENFRQILLALHWRPRYTAGVRQTNYQRTMNEPQPSLPPNLPTGSVTNNGLSTTSLVLGLLSVVCFGLLTGLPAIITGHLARGKVRRQPEVYGGGGMALAGLILGYVSVVTTLAILAITAALILPALAKAKSRASFAPTAPQVATPVIPPSVQCVNNLKQIGLAARIWANDHSDKFPENFLSLSNELVTPTVLVCPGDAMKTQASDWAQFNTSANVSYEFLKPDVKQADVSAEVVFRCPIHGHTGLGDGSVRPGTRPVAQ